MMPVTGKEIYEIYIDKMLDEGIGLDSWENLERGDQRGWDALAAELLERAGG
jgi:hypothetical protein